MLRRLAFCLLVLAVAAPAAAFAARPTASDGTLVVKRARGSIAFAPLVGTTFGRLDKGSIKIVDPNWADGAGPQVWGCDQKSDPDRSDKTADPDDIVLVCTGKNLRFRAVGGRYRITISGVNISLSAVGRGKGTLNGDGDKGVRDGQFSLNDNPFQSLPDDPQPFVLTQTADF